MSCDSSSNFVSRTACRLSAGISGMSGKKAFAIGAAAGSAGTSLAAAIIAQRRRLAGSAERRKAVYAGLRTPIPGLASPSRPRPVPIPGIKPGARPPKPKPVPIPGIKPGAPPPRPRPAPIPGVRRGEPQSKPIRPTLVKLQPKTVFIQGSDDGAQHKREGYNVVHLADGANTGLAITPDKKEGEWGVTHVASGALISGSFSSPKEAQQLAGKLAHLQWNTENIPPGDVATAKAIVDNHQGKAGEKQ